MEQRIIFNGKIYRNTADMPPDVRAIYEKFDRFFEDANQDGVPDVLQGTGLQADDVLMAPSTGNFDHFPMAVDFTFTNP